VTPTVQRWINYKSPFFIITAFFTALLLPYFVANLMADWCAQVAQASKSGKSKKD
jgi:hypothetical protein